MKRALSVQKQRATIGLPYTAAHVRDRIDSRNEWLKYAAKYAQDGDMAGFRRCALRACRNHARALVWRSRP